VLRNAMLFVMATVPEATRADSLMVPRVRQFDLVVVRVEVEVEVAASVTLGVMEIAHAEIVVGFLIPGQVEEEAAEGVAMIVVEMIVATAVGMIAAIAMIAAMALGMIAAMVEGIGAMAVGMTDLVGEMIAGTPVVAIGMTMAGLAEAVDVTKTGVETGIEPSA